MRRIIMHKPIVIQTDFGLSDGAVNAMYGVAMTVEPSLKIYDLTHDIPQYNIWEASYRLFQTIAYWPEETVFVSVVDPGVGTDRRSIVVKTTTNQYIVTPDNGTLTHINQSIGISEVRIIDEEINRLPRSGDSYTFHGRDIYAYTAARLASNIISFSQIGPEWKVNQLVELTIPTAELTGNTIFGHIDILDVRFGNVWTNIDRSLLVQAGIHYGDMVEVKIENNRRAIYKNNVLFGRSFADSHLGEPVMYINSVDKLGIAINQGSFAKAYRISTGSNWKISITKS